MSHTISLYESALERAQNSIKVLQQTRGMDSSQFHLDMLGKLLNEHMRKDRIKFKLNNSNLPIPDYKLTDAQETNLSSIIKKFIREIISSYENKKPSHSNFSTSSHRIKKDKNNEPLLKRAYIDDLIGESSTQTNLQKFLNDESSSPIKIRNVTKKSGSNFNNR